MGRSDSLRPRQLQLQVQPIDSLYGAQPVDLCSRMLYCSAQHKQLQEQECQRSCRWMFSPTGSWLSDKPTRLPWACFEIVCIHGAACVTVAAVCMAVCCVGCILSVVQQGLNITHDSLPTPAAAVLTSTYAPVRVFAGTDGGMVYTLQCPHLTRCVCSSSDGLVCNESVVQGQGLGPAGSAFVS